METEMAKNYDYGPNARGNLTARTRHGDRRRYMLASGGGLQVDAVGFRC